jgi:hypothetical protein
MKRIAIVVLGWFALIGWSSGCSATGKLPPCQVPNPRRLWCRCEVAQTTEARAAAGLPVACTIPFATTMCVDQSPGGFAEFLTGLGKIKSQYSAPGGWPQYVTVGTDAYWLRCPANNADGTADCVLNGQPTNPWPTLPVADLDAPNPITPGIKPLGYGGADTGGGGGGGGSAEGGDCAICLASADCTGLTQDECTTMHCAAVCPWDSVPAMQCTSAPTVPDAPCAEAGSPCDSVVCCAGLFCTPTDLGTTCM